MNGASQGCCSLNKKLKNKNMNHKEALEKIEELSSHLNDTFTTMHEINHLATEALQSESEQPFPSIEKGEGSRG